MYKKKALITLIALGATSLVSSVTFAAEGCKFLPVAPSILAGTPMQQSVCVDVPVNLNYEKAVFNVDTKNTRDGTASGDPAALRHMWMLANANKFRVNMLRDKLGLDESDYSIIATFQGKAANWGLSDEWWQANVPGATGNPIAGWITKLLDYSAASGIKIQLEICGATMYGKGWTNADVYPGVLVNQGAIGRLIELQQQGYSYIQEGYIDNDSMFELKDDDDDKDKEKDKEDKD